MNEYLNIINELVCAFNEIVWPASTFMIWMVSVMYALKKGHKSLEYILALFVISIFAIHFIVCLYQRKPIGINIPLSVGLICSILFYLDWKKTEKTHPTEGDEIHGSMDAERNDDVTCHASEDSQSQEVLENTKQEEPAEYCRKSKARKSKDNRTIIDFVIGEGITDKAAYIRELQAQMEGRRGQKALEECILQELGRNISTDITFRAFDMAFPNVVDKAGFSRFKNKIPPNIIIKKL